MSERADEAVWDEIFGRGAQGGLYSYGKDYPTSIRCKHCGDGPFEWQNIGTWSEPRWRLFGDDDTLHVCSQKRLLAKLNFKPLD